LCSRLSTPTDDGHLKLEPQIETDSVDMSYISECCNFFISEAMEIIIKVVQWALVVARTVIHTCLKNAPFS
jgi:hypothetical protein